MDPIIKLRIYGMFFLYTILSIISFYMKMTFYPEVFIILFTPIFIIRFLNTMIAPYITISISIIIFGLLYLFWHHYFSLNILAYIVSLLMIATLIIDYINVVRAYGIFSGRTLTQNKLLYYLNPRYKLLITGTLTAFLISFILNFI